MELIIGLSVAANVILYIFFKKRGEREAALIARKIDSSLELKKTLAMGLYLRFNYPRVKDANGHVQYEKGTELFMKQLPYDFEDFVASVYQKRFGGDVFVTNKSGDFGVDFEQVIDGELFLGQAKAFKHDVGYEPIAILHSNMIKQNAKGGYLITTAQFTDGAWEYAKDLNIQLIDGVALVENWLESLDQKVYSLETEFA